MNFVKPAHGFNIAFSEEAREQFDRLCDDPEQCRRVVSMVNRLSVSGHIDGEPVDYADFHGDRQFSERGQHDWLVALYCPKVDTITFLSIKRFSFED